MMIQLLDPHLKFMALCHHSKFMVLLYPHLKTVALINFRQLCCAWTLPKGDVIVLTWSIFNSMLFLLIKAILPSPPLKLLSVSRVQVGSQPPHGTKNYKSVSKNACYRSFAIQFCIKGGL
ncbi:hypothetical protein PR048_011242 [Dryococelus australis]|uniref:Uncharacterized protein n=1 Tax=Dryococelus australis TaxID=614101 RepID=A0ABQ9HL06_9NEOP|nr:hypothetical protein PR048_011242 [Dryococelus australis]